MPKLPEGLVKTIAWILVVMGAFLFVTEIYNIQLWIHDSYAKGINFILMFFSVVMFSTGAVVLGFKGSRFFKVILGLAVIIAILGFFAGELGIM